MVRRGRAKAKREPRRWIPRWQADRRRRRLLLRAAGWMGAAVLLAGAWVLGVPRMRAYASAAAKAGPVRVRFAETPAWAQGELASGLLEHAAGRVGGDPMRRKDLVAVRETLLGSGWLEGVRQVRRLRRDLVEVEAVFVRPFAVIRDAAGRRDHLVDPRGRLLPRSYPAGEAAGFAAILGARLGRPAAVGEPWPGRDVTAALDVLHLVHGRPWRRQIAAVDVAGHAETGRLQLITDRGCAIVWGRPPGEEGAGEVPAAQKLAYLDYHFREYGHVDRGFTQELDITGDVVIGR